MSIFYTNSVIVLIKVLFFIVFVLNYIFFPHRHVDDIFQFFPGDVVGEFEVDAAFAGFDFGVFGMELCNAGDDLSIDRGTKFAVTQAHPALTMLEDNNAEGDFILGSGVESQDKDL